MQYSSPQQFGAPVAYAAPSSIATYAAPTTYAAPMSYAAPVTYASPATYAAPTTYAAPATYAAGPVTYAAPATYGAPVTYGTPATYGAPVRQSYALPNVNWADVNAKLPYGQDPEEKRRRNKIFRDIDINGNGFLSLAEVDKGMRDIIRLDVVFDCKPAMMRAFQAAKNYGGDTQGYGPDYIEKREFRIFLQYLRSYFELYQMFAMVDINGDRRVSFDEFRASIGQLQQWGVAISEADAAAVFQQIDIDAGGMILFTEFADWAIAQKLDLGEESNRPVAGPEMAQYAIATQEYLQPGIPAAYGAVTYGAPATYAAPTTYAAPMSAAYAAPATYGAPVTYAAPTTYAEPMVTYAAPTTYAAPATYAAPMAYGAPATYGSPVTYAAPTTYAIA